VGLRGEREEHGKERQEKKRINKKGEKNKKNNSNKKGKETRTPPHRIISWSGFVFGTHITT